MPGPLSLTDSTTCSRSYSRVAETSPPVGVNLNALSIKLAIMRCMRRQSPAIGTGSDGTVHWNEMLRSSAVAENISWAVRTSAARSNVSSCSSSAPASALANSRILSISGTIRSHSSMAAEACCRRSSGRTSAQLRLSSKPRTRARGVRRSWAMLDVTSCSSRIKTSMRSSISLNAPASSSISVPSVPLATCSFKCPRLTRMAAWAIRFTPAIAFREI